MAQSAIDWRRRKPYHPTIHNFTAMCSVADAGSSSSSSAGGGNIPKTYEGFELFEGGVVGVPYDITFAELLAAVINLQGTYTPPIHFRITDDLGNGDVLIDGEPLEVGPNSFDTGEVLTFIPSESGAVAMFSVEIVDDADEEFSVDGEVYPTLNTVAASSSSSDGGG